METTSEVTIKVSKKRWFILGGLVLLIFMSAFNLVNFGLVNNIMVIYFRTTYVAVDWMVLGCNLGALASSPVFAYLSFKQLISYDKVMIFAAFVFVVDYVLVIIAFIYPRLFVLLVLGQVIGGVALTSVFTLPTTVAQLWFPESEIALATGLGMIGSTCGGIFSYLVIPSILRYPSKMKHSLNSTIVSETSDGNDFLPRPWEIFDQKVYIALFSIICFVAFVLFVLFLFFLPKRPAYPPSYAQYLKQMNENNVNETDLSKLTFGSFLRETGLLFKDYVFVASSFASGINYHLCDLNVLIMQQLVRDNSILTSLSPSVSAGLIMFAYALGCVIGNVSSGKLLDIYKKYYLQISISSLGTFLAAIATLLSVYYLSVPVLFISKFFVGIFARVSLIALIDSLMQHTYPKHPLMVTAWITFVQTFTAIVIVEVGRQIFNFYFSIGLLAFICALGALSLVLALISKTDTNRLSAEETRLNFTERSLLINETKKQVSN